MDSEPPETPLGPETAFDALAAENAQLRARLEESKALMRRLLSGSRLQASQARLLDAFKAQNAETHARLERLEGAFIAREAHCQRLLAENSVLQEHVTKLILLNDTYCEALSGLSGLSDASDAIGNRGFSRLQSEVRQQVVAAVETELVRQLLSKERPPDNAREKPRGHAQKRRRKGRGASKKTLKPPPQTPLETDLEEPSKPSNTEEEEPEASFETPFETPFEPSFEPSCDPPFDPPSFYKRHVYETVQPLLENLRHLKADNDGLRALLDERDAELARLRRLVAKLCDGDARGLERTLRALREIALEDSNGVEAEEAASQTSQNSQNGQNGELKDAQLPNVPSSREHVLRTHAKQLEELSRDVRGLQRAALSVSALQ